MVPANSCKIPRVPHYSGAKLGSENFRVRDYHALWCAFPHISANRSLPLCLIPRPQLSKPNWFRLFRVRSPLLAESLLFSFPSGTEMVHFPEFALAHLCIQWVVPEVCSGGFPHSEISGYNACVRLTEAYRSLPRPSSPVSAKASTVRP